ncbi:hypothetical protein C8Q72DRAFT_592158 [Fomitopsis betulina]|nr:hypothetical protein C8Q72DRAFT_592158 [Fomitopsis betulina]
MRTCKSSHVSPRSCSNVTLVVVGSTAQNLCLPDGSDIDLCMATPDTADHAAKVEMLNTLSDALPRSQFTKATLVYQRVPLVSFKTIPELGQSHCHARPDYDGCMSQAGSYQCDMCINSNTLQGVTVIDRYLGSMPALRYLVLFIKSYLARIELGSGEKTRLSNVPSYW